MHRPLVGIPFFAMLLLAMFAGIALATQHDEQTTILRHGMQPPLVPPSTRHSTHQPTFQNQIPGSAGSLKLPAQRPRYETFAPTIEVFLKEHLFADIFMRDGLDYKSREIATVGVISNLPGANAQLQSHIGLAMTQGFSEQQMQHLFRVMGTYLGKERGDNALAVLQQAVSSQKK